MRPSELWPDLEPFDDVVMKALSRDPNGRFQSADELGEALDAAAGRTGVAKTRDVAEVVRSLDAEKLQGERQRVRDSIDVLGRAEIAESKVPMPREGVPIGSRTSHRNTGTGSYVHWSISGVLSDGTPVVVQTAAPDSNTLKWFVMVLASVVFLYAGFLVWQLLRPPAAQSPPGPAPTMQVEQSPIPSPGPTAVEPADAETEEATSLAPPTKEVRKAPERKSSTTSSRPRRRKARPKSVRAVKPAPEPGKPEKKAAAPEREPAPARPDPVDIDIQNPYRN